MMEDPDVSLVLLFVLILAVGAASFGHHYLIPHPEPTTPGTPYNCAACQANGVTCVMEAK